MSHNVPNRDSAGLALPKERPSFFATLLLSLLALVLGGLGSARAQILPEEAGLVLCEPNTFERKEALTPDQVADIEGITAQLLSEYGEKVGKVQDLLADDLASLADFCQNLRADAQVIADIEGFRLIDGDETALGNWRPALLNFEVAIDDVAVKCQFVDAGLVGTKVLYDPFGFGLFVDGEERSYVANFPDRQIWVAIDPDGRRLGHPFGDPFGDEGDDDGTTTPEPTENNCENLWNTLWSQCWDNPDSEGVDPTRGECQICCTQVYIDCYNNNTLPNAGNTQNNYDTCDDKCDELPSSRTLSIQLP